MRLSVYAQWSPWANLHMVGTLRFTPVDINQQSLPTPFILFLVSVSVSMVLSTIFCSIKSLNNSLLSRSVLPVLLLP